MSKITRAFQKIFADGITPTGNIAEFGSLAEGTPLYSKDPIQIQSRAAWLSGWAAATIGNQSPAFQDFNAYQYLISRQIAYLLQAGIAEWDADTTFYTGSFCQVAGIIYRSKTDNNQGNAVTDTGNWLVLLSTVATTGAYADLTGKPTGQLTVAWVNFRGDSGIGAQTINSQFNVASVTRTGTGIYTLAFTLPLNNATYCVTGSGSNGAGRPLINGEEMSGSAYSLKSTTQLKVVFENSSANFSNAVSGNIVIYST